MGILNQLAIRRKFMIQAGQGGGGSENLPAGYQKVYYIENTGTQWIATDYIMTISSSVLIGCDFAFTVAQTSDSMLFGATPNTLYYNQCYLQYNNGIWYAANGTARGNAQSDIGSIINVRYRSVIQGNRLVIDGEGVASIETALRGYNMNTMYIFARHSRDGSAQYIHKGARIYSLKFTVNGTVEANFVPCVRSADNKPGVYDTVANKFYVNSGSGEFIAGPVIS